MGTIRIEGIRCKAYSDDHLPIHIHAVYAEIEVVVDLLPDGNIALAKRPDAVKPGKGSVADVRHVLDTAAEHFDRLMRLWQERHG